MEPQVCAAVVASSDALVVLLSDDATVARVNPAAARVLAVPADGLQGCDGPALLSRPREVAALRQSLRQVLRNGSSCFLETRLPSAPDAAVQTVAWSVTPLRGEPPQLAMVGVDISSTRTELDELQNRALTDELTGLGNRARLMVALQELSGTGATVVFCDLNGFKAVNDTHGHAAGDAVLVEVARRFVRAVRGEDLVVRLGGDEFVIVAPASPSSDPEGLRRRVVGALRQPMLLGGGLVVMVGVAVGVAELSPGMDPDAVLRLADGEMYAAKPSRSRTDSAPAPAPRAPAEPAPVAG